MPDTTTVFCVLQTRDLANGGVESISQIMTRVRTVRPVVVTQIDTGATPRWLQMGLEVNVWRLPYEIGTPFWSGTPWRFWRPVRRAVSFLVSNLRMYRLVRRLQVRVVHCNDAPSVFHYGVGARLAGARTIQSVRDTKPSGDAYGMRWRVAARLCHRTVVLSKEMVQVLRRPLGLTGPLERRLGYIYSVVDPQRLHPIPDADRPALRKRLGISDDQLAIGYVGALNRKKAQLDLILQATPRLVRHLPQARVYLVGDFDPHRSPYAECCRGAVQELGLRQFVRFVGFTPQVAEWYQALDIVVLASRSEGLARSMIESLSCGTPVVSFDVCSAREILVEHECGRVVPQGDYAALVAAIVEVARNPALRQTLSARAAQLTRQLFRPEIVVHRYETLYHDVAAERNETD